MSLLDTASLIVTPNGYKEGKLYSVIPSDGSGDMSVVRATTATRVNSAGLVELVPYNLFQYSEQFENGVWSKLNAGITPNATTAPNGTNTADLIDYSTGLAYCFQAINLSAGVYNFSVYLKGTNGQRIRLYADGTGTTSVNFNCFITDEWERYDVSVTQISTDIAYFFLLFGEYVDPSERGDFFAWGAQLNEGTAKDYQRTETRLNIPRLDYSNGSCPSLLVEPQRTNNLLYSSSFDNAAWDKQGATVTANNTTAPDGTMSADRVVFSGANKTIRQPLNMAGATITASVYIKGTAGQTIGIDDIFATQQIVTLTGEWQRLQFTAVSPNGYGLGISTFGGVTATTIYLWGAQLEAGSYPTSYIPTTSASVTRNADFLTRAGFGNTSTSGTLFFDFYAEKIESPNGLYMLQLFAGSSIGGAFFSDANSLSIIGNGPAIQIYNNAYTQQVQTFIPTAGQRVKIAIRYNGTNVSSAINGTLSSVFADTAVGVKNALRINNGESGTQAFNAVAFFPSYLTNDQLTALTTI